MDVFKKAANGELEVTEKTDGQNLFVAYNVAEGTAKAVEYDPDARFYDRISGTSLPPITSEKDEFTEQQEIIHHGYSPATYDIGTGGKKMYY